MTLSRIVRVRCLLLRSSRSARFRSVTSRVKQRVWTNSPSRNITLESISTSLIDPSLHRSRAGYSASFSPALSRLRMSQITSSSAWKSAMGRPTYSSRL